MNFNNLTGRLAFKLLLLSAILISPFSHAQDGSASGTNWKDRIYYGGNIGMTFGNPTFIDISPIAGYRVTEKLSAGLGLNYMYYSRKINSNLKIENHFYGGRVFSRYLVAKNIFTHVEDEVISAQVFDSGTGRVERRWINSVMAGGGVIQPLGGRAFFTLTTLYIVNFNKDNSPYQSPWVVRAGFFF